MKTKSLRRAINEKCKQCIYDSCGVGKWREQVESCTVKLCPLWEVRPTSLRSSNKNIHTCEHEHSHIEE